MLAAYACTALILVASLVVGRAILVLLRWNGPAWISGATGLAALVVLAPFLVRLPGRATTAAILTGLLVVTAAVIVFRAGIRPRWGEGAIVVGLTLLLATIPFVVNDRVGVLGEGIYTNDHAAQLYWADWLQHGFGPQPSAVRFGYPIGPQAVAVIAAGATGATLVAAFNGLLLAIPALTGLAALGAMPEMPRGRRIAIAVISGLPYLAASFLAQSAFKETAMGLFVLAFAIALASLPVAGWRGVAGAGLILAAAAVFTFSIPGLAWFAIAVSLWLALEQLAGRSPVDWRAVRDAVAARKVAIGVGLVVLAGLAAAVIGPAIDFVEKIGDVQESAGRLSSPVFPGEAFGVWPAGDFRLVRGEVSGGLLAAAAGGLAAIYGAYVLIRRREMALLAMLVTTGVVYVGARLFAQIHVEAKALAIAAPLVLLVGLRALLAPGEREASVYIRWAYGAAILVAAVASTLIALHAAPIGYDDRQEGLEELADTAEGDSVVFLGVDRFAGYYLRGTLARAPAGYVPQEIAARSPAKTWQQGQAVDFDTLAPGKLDKFRYAITTEAAYASTPPANFEPVAKTDDYVLWRRNGETPRSRVLPGEVGAPGAILDCRDLSGRPGTATVLDGIALMPYQAWELPPLVEHAAGGQERAFAAPGEANGMLDLRAQSYALSLQYHSQVPLEVLVDGATVAELPPSLEGMYLDGAGRGAFWPAGELASVGGPVEVTVRATEPTGLQDAVGAERRVWLGDLAATPLDGAEQVPLAQACGRYVDHFTYDRSRNLQRIRERD